MLVILPVAFIISCQPNTKKSDPALKSLSQKEIDSIEQTYAIDSTFNKGDVRRYGISPETIRKSHPVVKKNNLAAVLDLAEKTGMSLNFPKVYYPINLNLDGRKNIKLHFDETAFEEIRITNRDGKLDKPENVELLGTLVSYVRFAITNASKIKIDTILLQSEPDISVSKMRNKGFYVYLGVEDLQVKYVEIDDLGSGGESFKNIRAAFDISEGIDASKEVSIDALYVKSSDRYGVHIAGSDHTFGKITIDKFGVGSIEDMNPYGNSNSGIKKAIAGVFMDNCTGTFIEEIEIDVEESIGKNTFIFEKGDIYEPTQIEIITILNYKDDLPLDYPPNVLEIGEIIKI